MPQVKILVVTDDDGGYQRSTAASHKFHVGEFVKVLNDTAWDGFAIQITRAHRSADPSPATPQPTHPIGADLYGFRFSAASLTGFDMVFFFSIANKGDARAEIFVVTGGKEPATRFHERSGGRSFGLARRVRCNGLGSRDAASELGRVQDIALAR